jgi:Peptidase C13 family
MPLRLTACLCAAVVLLLLAATMQNASPASGRWQAVLAAGDVAEPVFDNAVAAFSQWLTARGVAAGDIHRLSANPARAEATAEPASAGQLLRRIALLPARQDDRCLVFITSHGEHGRGLFLAYAHELLTPAALADALSVGCANVPTVIIVSSCYSGSFAAGRMLASNRIILTAARADRPSFGCQADRTYTVFDECLLAALPRARLWRGVFDASLACVRQRERQMGVLPSQPQHFFGSRVRNLPVL